MKKILSMVLILAMILSIFTAALAEYALGDRTLSKGMSGQDVLQAQERLAMYSYYSGTLDGKYGSGTYKAVRNFQSRNGLPVTGIINAATAAVLKTDSAVYALVDTATTYVLSLNATGEAVKELQRNLRDTYYYAGTISGTYDTTVATAVRAFQASAGLKVDGKAGEQTKTALYNRSASIFNGGIPVRTLSSGSRGYDVYVLQQKLLDINYLTIVPTGYYATATVSAVKAFQKDNSLTITGTLDTNTKRALWPTTTQTEIDAANESTGTVDDPYTEPTVRYGSHGSTVVTAQMYLKAAGYLLGSADGIFGTATLNAVKKLQSDYALTVDGVIGRATWAILKLFNISNLEPTVVDVTESAATVTTTKLKRGSRGSLVTKLQQALIQLGYLPVGEDDGIFGILTYNAVKEFQRQNGLSVDGIAGTQTLVALNEELGVQYISP